MWIILTNSVLANISQSTISQPNYKYFTALIIPVNSAPRSTQPSLPPG